MLEVIKEIAIVVVPVAAELTVRLIPTKRNISIVGVIMSIFNALVPNKKKDAPFNHKY